MVDGEALLVALAHFSEDVNPGLGLHTVVGLDVQRSLRLDDLEHLRRQSMSSGGQLAKAPAGTTRVITFDASKPSAAVGGSGVIQKLRQAHRHQESLFGNKGVALTVFP